MQTCSKTTTSKEDETEEKSILISARDQNGNIMIIDTNKLKYCERLDGANVLKTLFGINDNSPYGKFPMKKTGDGHITLFRDLEILSSEWYLFTNFLNKGFVKGFIHFKIDKKYTKTFLNNLEVVNTVCTKLGGVPSFDAFYNNVLTELTESNKKTNDEYNPLTIEEDTKQLYQFASMSDKYPTQLANFISYVLPSNGWQTAKIKRIGRDIIYTYRRKKTIMDLSGNNVNYRVIAGYDLSGNPAVPNNLP